MYKRINEKPKDHLGNEFETIKAMIDHYGITRSAYDKRIRAGWSLEKTLTMPLRKTRERVRRRFANRIKVPVSKSAYQQRKIRGYSEEKANEKPLMPNGKNEASVAYDHKHQKYKNTTEMALAWNLPPETVRDRLHAGWTIKRALTTPVNEHSKTVTDSKGNTYPSWNAYAAAKGLTRNIVLKLRQKGYTIEQIDNYKRKDTSCTDHKGKSYKSEKEMCKAYGVNYTTYKVRRSKGMPVEEALTAPIYYAQKKAK